MGLCRTVTMAFRAAAELRKVGALPHDGRTTDRGRRRRSFLVGSPSSKPRRSAVMTHERAKQRTERERERRKICLRANSDGEIPPAVIHCSSSRRIDHGLKVICGTRRSVVLSPGKQDMIYIRQMKLHCCLHLALPWRFC